MKTDAAQTRNRRRGFSLVELLIAIFILGVGIISIAALLPAGIKQQQRSVDDVIGPIVANNAMAIIRSKVRPDDFGRFEDFSPFGSTLRAERFTIDGDWGWVRPSHVTAPDISGIPNMWRDRLQPGDVDVFSGFQADFSGGYSMEYPDGYRDTEYSGANATPDLYGIPFNRDLYGDVAPKFVISQVERYFPMQSIEVESGDPRRVLEPPKFVWDCMFRRFQGRVYVAVFVYRVIGDGGDRPAYTVVAGFDEEPPIPLRHDVTGEAYGGGVHRAWDPFGADDVLGTWDDAIVRDGSDDPCDDYQPFTNWQDPLQREKSWQHPGQWLLDQNNGVHQVIAAYCAEGDDSPWGEEGRVVELKRPVPSVPMDFDIANTTPGPYWLPFFDIDPVRAGYRDLVDDIWYVPLVDGAGRQLTPVYVTVREL